MNKVITPILLFGVLVISRLMPLPPNSEVLLGLGVVAPYISKSNWSIMFPALIMFVSDIFLGFHNSMLMTYTALTLAGVISKVLVDKLYTSLLCSWLVWHVLANVGQTYAPFTAESLIFDIRLLVSGLSVVVMYDLLRRGWQIASRRVSLTSGLIALAFGLPPKAAIGVVFVDMIIKFIMYIGHERLWNMITLK